MSVAVTVLSVSLTSGGKQAGKVLRGESSHAASSLPRPSPTQSSSPLFLNPPSEWSVSAGSAQDEMSYLRLILIS